MSVLSMTHSINMIKQRAVHRASYSIHFSTIIKGAMWVKHFLLLPSKYRFSKKSAPVDIDRTV